MYKLLHNVGVQNLLFKILKRQTLTILSLHQVSHQKNFFWQPFSPAKFEKLCAYLSKKYNIIKFSDIEEHRNSKKPLLILSFDDGYYDFIENAMPVLKKFNLPANHNIVYECVENNRPIWTERLNTIFQFLYEKNQQDAGFEFNDSTLYITDCKGDWRSFHTAVYFKLLSIPSIERDSIFSDLEKRFSLSVNPRMMQWDDVRALMGNNIEIGNHTYSHETISNISDLGLLEREIVTSKKLMEEKLNTTIDIFSYPNGQFNSTLAAYFDKAGYRYILEVNEKINALKDLNNKMNVFNRLTISDEPIERIILRVELLQSLLNKYLR